MNKKTLLSYMTLFSLFLSSNAFSEEIKQKPEPKYPKLSANLELGFLGVLDHRIQFSKNNTYFDYKKDGGQDVLFPISKYSLDFELDQTHSLAFLYQPLGLSSQYTLSSDMKQDNVTFLKGTPMKFLYDFPFFRVSYLYDFNKDPFEELAVGISLQLRNATIEFESLDGKSLVSKRNVGPVPILKFRSRNKLGENWWYGSEVDGFYAPVSYINGSTNEVTGAILDANIRFGANISDTFFPYLNLRYVSGGGVGQSDEKDFLGDGYANNWLHFLLLTVGINTPVIK